MDNNDKKTSKVEEKEKCVICGRYTDECVSTPITLRRFYVEGAGQVCKKCFIEIYFEIKNRP